MIGFKTGGEVDILVSCVNSEINTVQADIQTDNSHRSIDSAIYPDQKYIYSGVSPLVRPILENGSCVWCPQYTIHKERIESVQKNFLLFALRGLNWDENLSLPSYNNKLVI